MISLSRAALSLSARLGASRAAFATRATTTTTAGYGNKDDASRPGGGGGTAVHPAPPAPTNKEPLDVEREREEVRRHARGGTDPGINEEKMALDPGAERGPVVKSLHTAKGKIKEAVGEYFFCSFFFLRCWRRRRRRGGKKLNPRPSYLFLLLSFAPPPPPLSPQLNTFQTNKNKTGAVTEKVSHAFTAEGGVGRQFEPTGAVGSTVDEYVGGPFKADGPVGRQFRSDGAVGGTVETAAEAGQESGEQIKKAGKKEKETKK